MYVTIIRLFAEVRKSFGAEGKITPLDGEVLFELFSCCRLGPPIMFQRFGHHFIQSIGCRGGIDFVALEGELSVDGAYSVAEYVHLQLLGRRKACAVAVGTGDLQGGCVCVLINEVAERIETRGFQCAAEYVKVLLSV